MLRFLFGRRRRFPDWEAVRWKLHKDTDWHIEQRNKAEKEGRMQAASNHQIAASVLWGIAEALSYGIDASKNDLKR